MSYRNTGLIFGILMGMMDHMDGWVNLNDEIPDQAR